MKRIIALTIILIALGAWVTRLSDGTVTQAEGSASSTTAETVTASLVEEAVSDQTAVAVRTDGGTVFRVVDTATGNTVKELAPVPDYNRGGYPSMSPDGAWVYYLTGDAGTEHQIHRQNVENGVVEVIALNASQQAVSPVGDKIAFVRDSDLVVQSLDGGQQLTLGAIPAPAAGSVPAGVRSITWVNNERIAMLTSVDFNSFFIPVIEVGDSQLTVSSVRDSARGQVIGAGSSDSYVSVVDDMSGGLFVRDIALSGPGVIRQRAHSDEQTTVWDITADGNALLLTSGMETVRRAIDDVENKTTIATDGMNAGF